VNRRSKYLPSAACRRWRPRVSAHANRKPHRGVFRVDTLGPDGATWTNLSFGAALNTRRSFDGLNRLSEISNHPQVGSEISFNYSLNQANQRTTNSLADGGKWIYQYNERGEVVSGKKYFSDGTAVQGSQFEYDFDTIGNRTTVQDGTATAESTYTANNLNQYSQRTVADEILVTGSAVTGATVSVRLNTNNASLSNRHGEYFWKSVDVTNASALFATTNLKVTAYITSGTNSLVRSETRSAILPQTPEAFTWDADGNLLTDSLWTNQWDANNRMISTESRAAVPDAFKKRLSFQYDYMGRRTVKQSESGYSGGAYTITNTTTYAWDGWDIIAEVRSQPSGVTTNFYTWAIDASGSLGGAGGVGGLAIVSINGTNAYPFFNGNGDVMGLVSTSGTIVAEYEYSPVGVTLKATGPLAKSNPFRFSTKPTDDENGVVGFQQRDYRPDLARFTSADPIGHRGGIHLYAFVGNDPVNWFDFLGLAANVRVESFVDVVNKREALVVRVEVDGVPEKCEINFIQFKFTGTWELDLASGLSAPDSVQIPGLRPFYFNRADDRFAEYQSDVMKHYGEQQKKTYDPTKTTFFVDQPGKGEKKYFYLFIVERCCVDEKNETVEILDSRYWTWENDKIKQENKTPDYSSGPNKRNLETFKKEIERTHKRTNPNIKTPSDPWTIDVNLTIQGSTPKPK
jgi:RHS repeat-associated protein